MYPIRTAPLTFQVAATELALDAIIPATDKIYSAVDDDAPIDEAAEHAASMAKIQHGLQPLLIKHEIDLGDVSFDDTCKALAARVVRSIQRLLEEYPWEIVKLLVRHNLGSHVINLNMQRDADGQIIPDPSIVRPEEPAKA